MNEIELIWVKGLELSISSRAWTLLRYCSEEDELLSDVTFDSLGLDSENVESNSLWERSALSNSHDITNADSWECRWAMDSEVVVSLFESVVLSDVMQVISSDDDGSLHLGWKDDTPNYIIIINIYIIENKEACILKPLLRKEQNLLEDSASDWDVWGEWALLVNILSLNSICWCLESYTPFS